MNEKVNILKREMKIKRESTAKKASTALKANIGYILKTFAEVTIQTVLVRKGAGGSIRKNSYQLEIEDAFIKKVLRLVEVP